MAKNIKNLSQIHHKIDDRFLQISHFLARKNTIHTISKNANANDKKAKLSFNFLNAKFFVAQF